MFQDYHEPGGENPLTYLLEQALNTSLRGLMVSLPGRVVAFDANTQRAQIECGLNRIINGEPQEIPVIINVPVQFSGDSEWYFYHQITPNETEGLVHFSQRAAETWKQQGGKTTPVDFRMFSPQDAFFAPGFRSDPGVIPNFDNDGCGMGNYSGSVRLALKSSGITAAVDGTLLTLSASGFNYDGPTFTHNGTNVGDTHVHSQGNDSAGNGQQDTDGPK